MPQEVGRAAPVVLTAVGPGLLESTGSDVPHDRSMPLGGGGPRLLPRTVTSPAVGYYVPAGGMAPGARVRVGDVLGHVDVLGVRVEVPSPADGVVGHLLAQPGEAVEYGQELARVDPAPRARESAGETSLRPA